MLISRTVWLAGLLGVWVMTEQAADSTVGQGMPNFSSIDFPWYPLGGVRPPASGLGPVQTIGSYITRRQLVNGAGDIAERPLLLVDVNDPNLKPWAAEALKKLNEDRIAEKRSYTAHASCLPAGVPEFLTIGGAFQAMYLIQTPREVVMVNSFDSQARRGHERTARIQSETVLVRRFRRSL
jgi:hypothetical protein